MHSPAPAMRGRDRKKVSKGSQGEQGLELTHEGSAAAPAMRGRTREANLVSEALLRRRGTLVLGLGPVQTPRPPGPPPAANTSECPPLHSTPIFKV